MDTSLENIIAVFEDMNLNGFSINDELKWGFYFVDENPDKLKLVYNELADSGYILESLEDQGDNEYQLAVSKIEIISAEKLHRRNIAFNELAAYFDVESYDGWDVEKVI